MKQLATALLIASAAPALAITPQPGPPLRPSESIWQAAPTPKGGISWSVLESTKETTRLDSNKQIRSKPLFPPAVKALAGKRIRVNGYMMPLENSDKQSHFVLLAYPPDCPFHLNPAPMQFIEVRAKKPVPVSYDVKTIEGTLTLHGDDEQGVFYRFSDAAAL